MNRYAYLLAALFAAGIVYAQGHPDTKGEGWIDLMNGKDLTGWMNPSGESFDGLTETKAKVGPGWVVEDGVLVRKGGGGMIWTKARYGDFMLDLELKTTGNSGVFFRCDDPKNAVQTGIEMQVLPKGGPDQLSGFGAIYGCQAPSKEVGGEGWQHVTITCKDNMITVVINGEQVINMDVNRWDTPSKNPDGSKNKFKNAIKDFKREGHIGLQDHGAVVRYRNIKLKPLSAAK